MRMIATLALVVLVACAFYTRKPAASPQAALDPVDVHIVFAAIRHALDENDGTAAAKLVDAATLANFERIREFAIRGSQIDLESLNQCEVLLALRLRQTLDRKGLESIKGRTFCWAVENGIATYEQLKTTDLDQVHIIDQKATATVLPKTTDSAGILLHFEFQDSKWKLHWSDVEQMTERSLAKERVLNGLSKIALAESKLDKQSLEPRQLNPEQLKPRGSFPRIKVPGTSLSFVPFVEMVLQPNSAIYGNSHFNLVVIAFEIPMPPGSDPFVVFQKGFTEEKLQAQGVQLLKKHWVIVNGIDGLLFVTKQMSREMHCDKYILVLPHKTKCAQILVTLPSGEAGPLRDQVIAMLQSFRIESQEAVANVPYELDLPADWKLAKQVIAFELYSRGGQYPIPPSAGSFGVINLQVVVAPEQQDEFVEVKNLKRNHYSQCRVLESRNVVIDGSPANLSYVAAINNETGKAVVLQYCYIFLRHTTLLLESGSSAKLSDQQFEEISLSWRAKRTLR